MMHKPMKKRLKRNRVVVNSMDQQLQVYLSDFSSLAQHNDGNRYLACIMDVISKKVRAVSKVKSMIWNVS